MAWKPTDIVSADNFNAAYAFRQADNAAERWQKRQRQASISFDYRDPVDVGSVGQYKKFEIPDLRLLPGATSLKLKLRHRVTDVAGVNVYFGVWTGLTTQRTNVALLTSTTDATYEATLDLSDWLEDNNISDPCPIFLALESVETAAAAVTVPLTGTAKWFLETTSATGFSSTIACASVSLKNSVKGITLAEFPGGPHQLVATMGVAGATPHNRLYLWPWVTVNADATPSDGGQSPIYDLEYDQVVLSEFARLQFWSIGIEQIVTAAPAEVTVRGGRPPLIADGVRTKATLRPAYPARATTHRAFYQEQERMYETHTKIVSLGPSAGQTGAQPTATLRQGTWPCYPTVVFTPTDTATKLLFGCHIGDALEFVEAGGSSTRVRRSLTIDVSLAFVGGNADREYQIVAASSSGLPPFVVSHSSASLPFLVREWHPLNVPGTLEGDGGMFGHSSTFPLTFDPSAPGSANRHRRSNIIGLWPAGAAPSSINERIVHVRFKHFSDTGTEGERLTVSLQTSTSGVLLGDSNPTVGSVRCHVVGWCVTETQDGPALAVGK